MDNLDMRFREIIDTSKHSMRIDIVGAGSIGSNLTLLLARLGIKEITVYDHDTVEDHNLGHQAFRLEDIGVPKVVALQDLVKKACDIDIKTVQEKIDGSNIDTDILVLGTDSMESRKTISENAKYSFIVDGRMGGEAILVYSCPELEIDKYNETLYSDEEASNAPCGGRSIGYVSYIVSALMEIAIKKIILAEEVPFEQQFCAKNLLYTNTY